MYWRPLVLPAQSPTRRQKRRAGTGQRDTALPQGGAMALIIQDIAVVAGLGLLYLMMVTAIIVIAIIARGE